MKNSIEEDMKILEGIIKGDEDCINAIYSQMKVKNDNDEDIQYYKKEIQSIKNIVDNYLKEKARADKLEKEYSAMLTESDENECNYKRVLEMNKILLKENEELKDFKKQVTEIESTNFIKYKNYISKQEVKDKIEKILNNKEYRIVFEGNAEFPDDATIINAQKYIKLEKMQELIEESEEK